MAKDSKNDRLGAALKAAKKLKTARPKSSSLWTPKRAAEESRKYWASQNIPETGTARLHRDAIEIGKMAWKDSYTRIAEESEAIRERARVKLGLSVKGK